MIYSFEARLLWASQFGEIGVRNSKANTLLVMEILVDGQSQHEVVTTSRGEPSSVHALLEGPQPANFWQPSGLEFSVPPA